MKITKAIARQIWDQAIEGYYKGDYPYKSYALYLIFKARDENPLVAPEDLFLRHKGAMYEIDSRDERCALASVCDIAAIKRDILLGDFTMPKSIKGFRLSRAEQEELICGGFIRKGEDIITFTPSTRKGLVLSGFTTDLPTCR